MPTFRSDGVNNLWQDAGNPHRSNGGVLTSVSITQRPELFGAAVIESPPIDVLAGTPTTPIPS